jgi:hypothetical protein
LRKPLLEVVGQHRFCQQIGGCAVVLEAGGFLAQAVPFIDGAVTAAQPRPIIGKLLLKWGKTGESIPKHRFDPYQTGLVYFGGR